MSGSEKGTDMRHDESAYESEEVQSSIAKHLASLRGEEVKKPPTQEPENDELEADDNPTSESDGQDDPASPEDEEESPTQDDNRELEAGEKKPAIPENVYRSVLHNGWKPEEIAEFYKANPKQAMKVFEKLHQATNDLSRQFAEIGRTRINIERRKSQPETKEESPQSFIDVEAIRKQDPDNPLLPIVEGMNKALTQLTVREPAEQLRQQARQQEDVALATQILAFLGSDQMKMYNDFYGPAYDDARIPTFDGHGLTPGQRANRNALLEQADAIWVGAREHGRNLTVPEALSLAHSLLTDGMRTQQVRQELVSKVKQRAKGMTLRPANGKSIPKQEGDKPKTEKELEARTEARLAKLRNRR